MYKQKCNAIILYVAFAPAGKRHDNVTQEGKRNKNSPATVDARSGEIKGQCERIIDLVKKVWSLRLHYIAK